MQIRKGIRTWKQLDAELRASGQTMFYVSFGCLKTQTGCIVAVKLIDALAHLADS